MSNPTLSEGQVFPAPLSIVQAPASPALRGIEWLGPAMPYPEPEKRGDTFPITWAADGHLYTSAGDPCWPGKGDGLNVQRFLGDPPDYRIEKCSDMDSYRGWGGAGPKPTGMIAAGGRLYLAFQNLTGNGQWEDSVVNYGHGYDAQIICSDDSGASWQPEIKAIERPMFPGRIFGAPAFVNFGRNNQGARDGYVYAISGEGWDNGCHCRLGRVPAERIMERAAWQFVAGFERDHVPVWSGELDGARPVLTHCGYLGAVDMVYLAGLGRYLLLSWHHKVKGNPDAGSELIVYDTPEPWGPFTLVHHEDPWETPELNPYNPRLPLKWFDQGRNEGWLLFSGSWRQGGQTPFYRAHVRHVRLRT